jgi:hypothetical protein
LPPQLGFFPCLHGAFACSSLCTPVATSDSVRRTLYTSSARSGSHFISCHVDFLECGIPLLAWWACCVRTVAGCWWVTGNNEVGSLQIILACAISQFVLMAGKSFLPMLWDLALRYTPMMFGGYFLKVLPEFSTCVCHQPVRGLRASRCLCSYPPDDKLMFRILERAGGALMMAFLNLLNFCSWC